MRNSILKRTFRYFLISMCAIILVFSAFVLSYLNRQYREQFVSSQLYVTEKTAESVEELLLNIKQSAYYLCCNEALAKAVISDAGVGEGNQRRLISEAFIMNISTPAATMMQSAHAMLFVDQQFPFAQEATFFNMSSMAGSPLQRVYSARDVQDEEWYQESMRYDAQTYAFTDPAAPDKVLFAHKLRSVYLTDPRYSDCVGVVLYALPASALKSVLKNDQMSEGSVSLLLFNEQILSSTKEDLVAADNTAKSFEAITVLLNSGETASVEMNGVSYSVSSMKVNNRWRVVVMTPTANMWQSMQSMLPMLGTFALALILMSLIISTMFSRRLSAPIRNLSDAMIRARKAQELPQTIPVPKSDDEIEYLYHSYNEIVDNIHHITELDREKNARLRKTELKALQSQINPHFVYNTLDSVACIALLNGEEDIATMVASLISILKYSIGFSNMHVRLEEEIDYLKQYIQIQMLRYHDGFSFVCDIPEQYNDVRVPKLMIQPLVENALFHAENAQHMLEIRVYCEEADGQFYIHVCDNGSGADAEQLNARLKTEGTGEKYGIGIVNVNKRIQLMAGAEYGIRYALRPDGGLDAMIVLPVGNLDF